MAEDQSAQKQDGNLKPAKPQSGTPQKSGGGALNDQKSQQFSKKRHKRRKKRPYKQPEQGQQPALQEPKPKTEQKPKSLEDLVLGTEEKTAPSEEHEKEYESTKPKTYEVAPEVPVTEPEEEILPSPPAEEEKYEPKIEPEEKPELGAEPFDEELTEPELTDEELLGISEPSEPELPEAPAKPEQESAAEQKPGKVVEPSPFHMEEKPKGPVGWDQLKHAIKKDYEETDGGLAAPMPVPTPEEKEPISSVIEEVNVQEVHEPQVETIEPEPSPVAPTEAIPEDDAEKKEVIRIIVKYVIRGCLVIAILLAIFLFKIPQLIYGGVVDFIYGGDRVDVTTTVDESGKVSQPSAEYTDSLIALFVAGSNKGTSLEKFEEGIQTVFVTGEDIPQIKRISSGIQTIFNIGLPEAPADKADRIATYMQALSKLQNAFATDIHQLLDNSSDRQKTLQLHLDELNAAQEEALATLNEINLKKDSLKIEFNEVTTLKDQYEKDFFAAMENLEGTKSNDLLNEFIRISQDQIDLKAEYNSLSKVAAMFDIATANMEARIKDIEYNKDALIQGVKVVDIRGSDLDLIIHEEEI